MFTNIQSANHVKADLVCMVVGARCFEYIRKWWLPGFFMHKILLSLYRIVQDYWYIVEAGNSFKSICIWVLVWFQTKDFKHFFNSFLSSPICSWLLILCALSFMSLNAWVKSAFTYIEEIYYSILLLYPSQRKKTV